MGSGAAGGRSHGQEGSNRAHVARTGSAGDAVAGSDRCVLLGTLSTFLNSTLLPLLVACCRPPLPRGGSGYRPPETSTGLFFFLELRSHVVVGRPRSGAIGGGTAPVLGRQIARRRGNGPWRRSWRPPQRFPPQRRYGPRRWPWLSTTGGRQEKSMKSYVRNPMKARSSRWAAAKERFGQLQERSKLCERLVARCGQFCSHTFGGS